MGSSSRPLHQSQPLLDATGVAPLSPMVLVRLIPTRTSFYSDANLAIRPGMLFPTGARASSSRRGFAAYVLNDLVLDRLNDRSLRGAPTGTLPVPRRPQPDAIRYRWPLPSTFPFSFRRRVQRKVQMIPATRAAFQHSLPPRNLLVTSNNKLNATTALSLFLLAYSILLVQGGAFVLQDPDTFWHIRTGQWILAHARVPTVDLYSYTAAGNLGFPQNGWLRLSMPWRSSSVDGGRCDCRDYGLRGHCWDIVLLSVATPPLCHRGGMGRSGGTGDQPALHCPAPHSFRTSFSPSGSLICLMPMTRRSPIYLG